MGARLERKPPRARAQGTRVTGNLAKRLGKIRLLLLDVDGVLTDTSVFVGGDAEIKRFNIQDGLGLRLLQKEGVKVGWISRRPSYATTLRAVELKVDFLHQEDGNKVEAIESILGKAKVAWDQVCFVGDDIVDLGAMRRAGVAVAVANAGIEPKAIAHYVTKNAGGHGAVREVVELILKAQGKWDKIIAQMSE